MNDICIAIAHYNEDLSWINHLNDFSLYVISKTDSSQKIFQPENLGFEASAYLEFICEMYDVLPEWVVFVHGHEYSWHHTGTMQDLVRSTIDQVKSNPDHKKYRNINNQLPHYYIYKGEDAGNYPGNPTQEQAVKLGLKTIRDCIQLGMFSPIDINECNPVNYIAKPCAQFVVHRDLIKKYPLETYKALKTCLRNTPYDDKMKACVFEAMWMRMFTGYWDELEWETLQP